MPNPTTKILDNASDSEDDADYIPPPDKHDHSESDDDSDDEPSSKRPRIAEQTTTPTETEEEKKEARDKTWKAFTTSVAQDKEKEKETEVKMVKIERRHLFAGEEVVEIVEVPEDSAEAKKWPIVSTTSDTAPSLASPSASTPPPSLTTTTTSVSTTASTTALDPSSNPKPKPKPGPRKPKTLLSAPTASVNKPKKITMLQKSAMDWSAATSEDKDELEANRRGGAGYLDKVEFLERVNERKDAVLEAGKGKRRRG
ncbi:hypothetical protein VNI00_006248 [Paramarasmius palmivorus]|uniref:SWR1-complex protein 5 n=1 Tax=Paramarasmius palmivorus TaxID=297713 RepID=A0AAW0D9B4_9AGAR